MNRSKILSALRAGLLATPSEAWSSPDGLANLAPFDGTSKKRRRVYPPAVMRQLGVIA